MHLVSPSFTPNVVGSSSGFLPHLDGDSSLPENELCAENAFHKHRCVQSNDILTLNLHTTHLSWSSSIQIVKRVLHFVGK